MDDINNSKNEYEERKRAKTILEEKEARKNMIRSVLKKIVKIIILIVLIGGSVLLVKYFIDKSKPKSFDFSVAVPSLGRDHIEVGTTHAEYNSNPPSSGPHYVQTARNKFYETAVPDEYVIHNLEHGDIWIAYKPTITDKDKNLLKDFAWSKVIITPREKNEYDISLVAWGRVDNFNIKDVPDYETRISDFIKRYRNKGPEKIPAGAMSNDFN